MSKFDDSSCLDSRAVLASNDVLPSRVVSMNQSLSSRKCQELMKKKNCLFRQSLIVETTRRRHEIILKLLSGEQPWLAFSGRREKSN